ncbi:hypothetical protein WUBG_12665, partial [Wuchereria bancrofti]
ARLALQSCSFMRRILLTNDLEISLPSSKLATSDVKDRNSSSSVHATIHLKKLLRRLKEYAQFHKTLRREKGGSRCNHCLFRKERGLKKVAHLATRSAGIFCRSQAGTKKQRHTSASKSVFNLTLACWNTRTMLVTGLLTAHELSRLNIDTTVCVNKALLKKWRDCTFFWS